MTLYKRMREAELAYPDMRMRINFIRVEFWRATGRILAKIVTRAYTALPQKLGARPVIFVSIFFINDNLKLMVLQVKKYWKVTSVTSALFLLLSSHGKNLAIASYLVLSQ